MLIRKVEEITGLSRATIRYYERLGLVVPNKLKHDFRNYSNDDVKKLYIIKALNELGIPPSKTADYINSAEGLTELLRGYQQELKLEIRECEAKLEAMKNIFNVF